MRFMTYLNEKPVSKEELMLEIEELSLQVKTKDEKKFEQILQRFVGQTGDATEDSLKKLSLRKLKDLHKKLSKLSYEDEENKKY